MRHYGPDEWLAYLDGRLLDEESTKRMRAHLDGGCSACLEEHDLWVRLRKMIEGERAFQVPQSAIDHIKRVFSIEPARAGLRTLIPRLSFDSLWDLAPIGERSSPNGDRTLVFQCGRIQIRLRAESKTPQLSWLDGQLFDESEEMQLVRDVPVSLVSEGISISEIRTNQFGEFHFDISPIPDAELGIAVNAEQMIVVPLAELFRETGRGGALA